MIVNKLLKCVGVSALAVVLSACGGGDGDDGGTLPPGPEAWVAGEYVNDCEASQVAGAMASTRSDLFIDAGGFPWHPRL